MFELVAPRIPTVACNHRSQSNSTPPWLFGNNLPARCYRGSFLFPGRGGCAGHAQLACIGVEGSHDFPLRPMLNPSIPGAYRVESMARSLRTASWVVDPGSLHKARPSLCIMWNM